MEENNYEIGYTSAALGFSIHLFQITGVGLNFGVKPLL